MKKYFQQILAYLISSPFYFRYNLIPFLKTLIIFFIFFIPSFVASVSINEESLSPKTQAFSAQKQVFTAENTAQDLPQLTHFRTRMVSFLFSHDLKGTTALVDSSSRFSISYQKLQAMVQSMASGLQKLGVLQNQVVLILLTNTILCPVLLLGCLSMGAIVTTMNPLSAHKDIEKSMQHCNLVTIFTTFDSIKKVESLGVGIVPVPDNINFDTKKFSLFDRIISSDANLFVKPNIRQTDMGAILHFSGTSGYSKGVVLTHANLIAAVELFVRFEALQYKKMSWENVYLATIRMFHVYGLCLL